MEARKIKEGEAHLVAGNKLLKTSTFGRWKPDWEGAAAEYEKAATAFRVAKAIHQAVGMFVKASEAHEKFDSGFMAAKHMETAAFLAGSGGLKEPAQSADLYERASALHQLDGRIENAGEALGKAARGLEADDAARAAKLVKEACELYVWALDEPDVSEGRLFASLEAYKLAVPLLLRVGEASSASALLRRQALVHARVSQPHNVARCELSAVVASLSAGDFMSATNGCDAAQLRGDGFAGSDEVDAAMRLLGAFEAQSAEALEECVGQQVFTFLDTSVAKAAKALTLRSAAVPASGDFGEVAPEDDVAPVSQHEEEELTDDLT